MNSKWIALFLILVSILGLASCMPVTSKDEWLLEEPHVVHHGHSVPLSIKIPAGIPADSQLVFQEKDSKTLRNTKLEVKTFCTEGEEVYQAVHHFSSFRQIPFANFIPLAAFRKLHAVSASRNLVCTFDFKARNEPGSSHRFRIDSVRILALEDLEKILWVTQNTVSFPTDSYNSRMYIADSEKLDFLEKPNFNAAAIAAADRIELSCETFANHRRFNSGTGGSLTEIVRQLFRGNLQNPRGELPEALQGRDPRIAKARQKCRILALSVGQGFQEKLVSLSPVLEAHFLPPQGTIAFTTPLGFYETLSFENSTIFEASIENNTSQSIAYRLPEKPISSLFLQLVKVQNNEIHVYPAKAVQHALLIEGGSRQWKDAGSIIIEIQPQASARIRIKAPAFGKCMSRLEFFADPKKPLHPVTVGFGFQIGQDFGLRQYLIWDPKKPVFREKTRSISFPQMIAGKSSSGTYQRLLSGWIPRKEAFDHLGSTERPVEFVFKNPSPGLTHVRSAARKPCVY